MATLDRLLIQRAREAPQRPMLVMGAGQPIDAATLLKNVGAVASFLERSGIGPGDRVALCGQNSVAWAIWLLAAAWRGAAIVALHPGSTSKELASAIEQGQPHWLVVDEHARGNPLGAMVEAIASDRAVSGALRGTTVMPGGDGDVTFDALLDGSAMLPESRAMADAPLALLFTSGSSGRQKLVSLSHRALMANARSTADASGIGASDRIASPLPLHHSAGLSSGLLLSLDSGALWCSTHRFEAASTLEQIRAHRCTVLQGVPTMFKAMMETAERQGSAPSSTLRLGFVGGAPCGSDLLKRAHDTLGIERLCVVYGQTETGPTISIASRAMGGPAQPHGAVGTPIPGVVLRIADVVTDQEVAPGASGEIRIRTPGRMDGYFGNVAESTAVIAPGDWLRTGDLGRIVDGVLCVEGRLKQIIIRGGENVSPSEVESVLREAPGVADVCVVPVASTHWGEAICAVVTPASTDAIDVSALRRLCTEHLARYKRPDHYVTVDRFPLLPSGKVDRQAVQASLAGKDLT